MDNPEDELENWNQVLEVNDGGSSCSSFSKGISKKRVIIHIDVDCFYAQVEEIRNPSLRSKMIGVQQKNLVITTNYVARKAGVPKGGFVTELSRKHPDLVLVNGEDLQHYRRFSKNIFETLKDATGSHVERLGMDENFIDVTALVQERLQRTDKQPLKIEGQIFQEAPSVSNVEEDLIMGSRIAKELRELLKSKIGITSSAGIARNKLLAKLVGSVNKPDDQTVLLDHQAFDFIKGSSSIKTIPGIGSSTASLLKETLKIETIEELRKTDVKVIADHLDLETAIRIKDLSMGIDNSEVKASGKVRTIGLEYRFKPLTTLHECKDKLQVLLTNLSKLISEDGRIPQTIKVTTRDKRKEAEMEKKFYKESRQTKIRSSLFNDLLAGSELSERNFNEVLSVCMKLFEKMADKHNISIALLGISVGDLIETKDSIQSFFARVPEKRKLKAENLSELKEESGKRKLDVIPPDWDPEVFKSLPDDIQQDLLKNPVQQERHCSHESVIKKSKPNNQSILNYFQKK